MFKKISCIFIILGIICLSSCGSKKDSSVYDSTFYAFDYLESCYETLDFTSNFESLDPDEYIPYVEQYRKLIDCEQEFTDKKGEYYYLKGYDELSNDYDPHNYQYYFFDINYDGKPELGISDGIRFIYIFAYNFETDEFVLWHEISTTRIRLMGSEKLWLYSGTSPVKYAFFQLDENGNEEYSVWFYIEPKESETNYMVSLPEYSNGEQAIEAPNEMKKSSVEKDSHIYYQVTKEQWDTLTKGFFEEKALSEENIKEVTYNYNELFLDV